MNTPLALMLVLLIPLSLVVQNEISTTKNREFVFKSTTHTMVEYRVIGFTTTNTDGDIRGGYLGMNQRCAKEVHQNSRAAYTVEYIRSNIPRKDIPQNGAWLIPTNIRAFYRPDLSEGDKHVWTATEEAGGIATAGSPTLAMENAMNCSNYSNNKFNRTGLIGSTNGIAQAACNTKRPIACVAPVVINALKSVLARPSKPASVVEKEKVLVPVR